jgi:hypothetical protein
MISPVARVPARVRRRGGQTSISGGAPVVRDVDGVVHNVRGFTAKSRVRSAMSNASRSDGKRQLETGRPRVVPTARSYGAFLQRKEPGRRSEGAYVGEEEIEVGKGGAGKLFRVVTDGVRRWKLRAPMRNFVGLVVSRVGGRKGDGGGGVWPSYRRGSGRKRAGIEAGARISPATVSSERKRQR